MSDRRITAISLAIVSGTILLAGCDNGANPKDKTILYGDYKQNFSIPPTPMGEISHEEADARRVYYKGYYDSAGLMIRWEKYLDGKLNSQAEYKYHDNGRLKERRAKNPDGRIIYQQFNRSGRLISSQWLTK